MAGELSVALMVYAGVAHLRPGFSPGMRWASVGLLALVAALAVHLLGWAPGLALWLTSLMLAAICSNLVATQWPAMANRAAQAASVVGLLLGIWSYSALYN